MIGLYAAVYSGSWMFQLFKRGQQHSSNVWECCSQQGVDAPPCSSCDGTSIVMDYVQDEEK